MLRPQFRNLPPPLPQARFQLHPFLPPSGNCDPSHFSGSLSWADSLCCPAFCLAAVPSVYSWPRRRPWGTLGSELKTSFRLHVTPTPSAAPLSGVPLWCLPWQAVQPRPSLQWSCSPSPMGPPSALCEEEETEVQRGQMARPSRLCP